MDRNHFQTQINRLTEVYGKTKYPMERIQMVWRKVQDLSDRWMTETVDFFVGYEQYAPMMDKWDEQISKSREAQWAKEKKQHAKDAKEFASIFSGEDIQTICGQIIKRIQGDMPDADFKNFNDMLKNLDKPRRCVRCEDSGCYFDKELGGLYLCNCGARDNPKG